MATETNTQTLPAMHAHRALLDVRIAGVASRPDLQEHTVAGEVLRRSQFEVLPIGCYVRQAVDNFDHCAVRYRVKRDAKCRKIAVLAPSPVKTRPLTTRYQSIANISA